MALGDQLFHHLSRAASGHTVLAHVRKATQGRLDVVNCHPFQHGRWTFAHNGDIPDFGRHRAALMSEVDPALRRFVLGDTDSEVIFFIILSRLRERRSGARVGLRPSAWDAVDAVRAATRAVRGICDGGERASLLIVGADGVGHLPVW